MNAKQLKTLLEEAEKEGFKLEELEVLIPGFDHSYDTCTISLETAMKHRRWGWSEDYGEKLTPETADEKRRDVIIISSG